MGLIVVIKVIAIVIPYGFLTMKLLISSKESMKVGSRYYLL